MNLIHQKGFSVDNYAAMAKLVETQVDVMKDYYKDLATTAEFENNFIIASSNLTKESGDKEANITMTEGWTGIVSGAAGIAGSVGAIHMASKASTPITEGSKAINNIDKTLTKLDTVKPSNQFQAGPNEQAKTLLEGSDTNLNKILESDFLKQPGTQLPLDGEIETLNPEQRKIAKDNLNRQKATIQRNEIDPANIRLTQLSNHFQSLNQITSSLIKGTSDVSFKVALQQQKASIDAAKSSAQANIDTARSIDQMNSSGISQAQQDIQAAVQAQQKDDQANAEA